MRRVKLAINRFEGQTLRVKVGMVMAGTCGLQLYLNEHTGAIRPYSVFLHEDALCLPGLSNDNLRWLLLDDLDVKNDKDIAKKKTILIINDNLPTNINGVVTFLKNMEKHAIDENYSVKYLNPSQFPHFDCPGYPDIKLSIPLQLASKIQAVNPDFIHIATEGPLGLATRLYCDRHGIPYNSAYHTRIPEYMNVQFGIPDAVGYGYLRWFHRNSRQVLTTTDTMVSELESRGFMAPINPMKFGVDRNIFSPKLRQEKTPGSGPVLLSVGRVSKEKGLDAFCELKYPGATKIVVGDGAYRKELEERYPDIHFVGYQSGKSLAEYYANADCLVFTSRTDTFGLVMIESMACGTPVAAFPVPGPLDAIESGVTGYLNNDLTLAVEMSLCLDRNKVEQASHNWSWESCWSIFQQNLVPTKDQPQYHR